MNMMASGLAGTASGVPSGTVAEVLHGAGDGLLVVEAGAMRLQARRAVSCLVEPEPGDLVLLGGDAARPFVLAVLERPGDAPVRIALRGDAEIVARGGHLRLIGEAGVEAASPGVVALSGAEVRVTARSARVLVDHLVHVGTSVSAHVGQLKVVGDALETIFRRVMSRMTRSFRIVEETDQLRSGSIDHRAEELLRLHARNTVVTASNLAKVDGAQIYLG